MKCKNCGKLTSESSAFCDSCGTKLQNTSSKSNVDITVTNKFSEVIPINEGVGIEINSYNIDHTNPLAKYNKLYTILIILGAGFGLLQGNPIAAIGLSAFGFLIAWIIVRAIAIPKLIKLKLTDYPLTNHISEDKIYEYLQQNFSHPEVTLIKKSANISFFYKNETLFLIKFNKESNTFNISSKMTIGSKIKNGGKANSAKLYINTNQVTPFIVKVIQNAAATINTYKH